MADRLNDFDFTIRKPQRSVPPFPLRQWFDGGIWCVWAGEDFEMDRRNMRVRLHQWAGHRGVSVVTRFVEDGERVGIVFRTNRPWEEGDRGE